MKDTGRTAAKAGAAYTIGNILLKGVTFLTLPIFSRLLTTEEYGLYNLYVSYETILTIFVGLCLYGSLRTAKYDYKEYFERYMASILTLSFVSFGTILFVGNITFNYWAGSFDFNRSILNILIIHSYAMFIFQFYNTKLALNFKYKQFLVVSGINSIGSTVLSILLIVSVFEQNKLNGRIYGYSLVPIILAVIICFLIIKDVKITKKELINKTYWEYGLKISIPLVVHTFSQQILHQFDRVMISRIINNSAVGVYGFIYTIANILQIIVQSLDNAWSVWMYDQLNENNYEEIFNKSKVYILLMNIFYIGFISLAPDVIHIAGTEAYYAGTKMIVPLAFSIYFVFLYSLPVHVEYYYKKTKYIAMGTSLAAVLNIVLNYIFIKKFGYQAAAWTTLFSYIALFIFHWVIAKTIDHNAMFPRKMIALSVVMLSVYSAVIIYYVNSIIIRWSVMVLSLVGLLFLCRHILNPMMLLYIVKKKIYK